MLMVPVVLESAARRRALNWRRLKVPRVVRGIVK